MIKCLLRMKLLHSSPLSAAYMRQWIGSASVQVMTCSLFGDKPLSKPLLVYFNWILRNKLQWSLIKIQKLSFTKIHMKISSAKWRPFCPSRYKFMTWNGKDGCLLQAININSLHTKWDSEMPEYRNKLWIFHSELCVSVIVTAFFPNGTPMCVW